MSAGLLALLLQNEGINARSWQGWQIPVLTTDDHSNSRIKKINIQNLSEKFSSGMQVAVVAGFQGISNHLRITTLGRGGSDTTAVALAAAFQAKRCDIYTDVDGVFTTDPKITPNAQKLGKISYEEMLELASLGSKVLQTRSVELAMNYKVTLRVLNSFVEGSGTLVCDEESIMERRIVSGITFSKDEAKLTLIGIKHKPGTAGLIFDCLSHSRKNTIRGLHFQKKNSQGKFITVVQGEILDVAVDLRKNSKTFGQHFSIKIKHDSNFSIYIPENFAHGFACLSKTCTLYYRCTNYRDKESETTLKWNDPNLNIKWKIQKPILLDEIYIGGSIVNLKKSIINNSNKIIKINPQEKKILEKMLSFPGKVFSRDDIGKLININKERTIDVMITRLRQKIESDSKNPKYLQTIRGSGYVLWIE